jgi:ribosome maturation factor RimP
MLNGRKRFRGKLAGVEGEEVRVALDQPASDGETFALVPLAAIAEAKLVLTDELIKESLRRQKPQASADETDEAGATRAEAH